MTEWEWDVCTDPDAMLAFLGHRPPSLSVPAGQARQARGRVLRLFACACCRRVWELLGDEWSRQAVEVSERFADGLAGPDELREAEQIARAVRDPLGPAAAAAWAAAPAGDEEEATVLVARMTANAVGIATAWAAWTVTLPARVVGVADDVWATARCEHRRGQGDLLRDLIGNPFRSVPFDPSWRRWGGGCVAQLAQIIYDDRRWEELGILADALEEAGCDRQEILSHCRSPTPHARGCWVLDGLLGRR
jgi:hypothetical protein